MRLTLRTVVFAFLVFATLIAGRDVVRTLVVFSGSDDSASHLPLIPFVAMALIYQDRRTVFAKVYTEWAGGLSLMSVGLAGSIATRMIRPFAGRPEELALLVLSGLVVVAGAFVLMFGWSAVKAARFGLLFLIFTMPIPPALLNGATALLKRASTDAVSVLFTLTGTPYYREGYVFTLSTLAIEVADACSGIRSTIALVLTSLMAGHVFLTSASKKALLVLAILPITILKNAIRIVTLSLLAVHVDPSFLAGRLHSDGGVVFFVLALGLLLPVLSVLRRWEQPLKPMDGSARQLNGLHSTLH